ncbi:MAG: lipid IV(A) 3-deoxy-D-manno-octulosonic acid transferase [Gammaproteobacteria bacterium]|nr:lipid IV(A) 3-deoxy-D-manno-octulosonic acid transferase [Gammaproteobacteria bacterium]
MSRLLYTLLYYFLTPLLFFRLLTKHKKSSAYKEQRQSLRLAERLGFFSSLNFKDKKNFEPPIWFHTVSVGEFLATLPLIRSFQQNYPQYPIVITCTTTTGSAQIIKTFSEEIKLGHVFHVYLPYDLPDAMKRFFKTLKPRLGIVMETEIWPNLLHVAQQFDIPVWLLNARMSEKSAKGYARFPKLIKNALNQFSGIAVQNSMDANRLKDLGANEKTLHITGSIKFDIKVNQEDINAGVELRKQLNWQDKKVLIAASTHKGEDEIILDIFETLKQQQNNLVMIVVPRHPERFQSVYHLLNNAQYSVMKRSQMDNKPINTDILLGDSMGEMMSYFACSDVVFMGGTMVPTGGHNIIEPAALGLPVVCGPHMFNFTAINELFLQYGASKQVADPESLINTLNVLLSDEKMANEMGKRAKALMEQNAGALNKMMSLISSHLQ